MAFALQRAAGRAGARGRYAALALRGSFRGALRAAPGFFRRAAFLRRLEFHAGPTRLVQADRDCLLARTRTVLALAHVMHFLAHVFAGLGAAGLAFMLGLRGALSGFPLGHGVTS